MNTRTTITLVAASLASAAAIAVLYAAVTRPSVAVNASPAVPTATAPVIRGTASARIQVAGTLGFDGDYPVIDEYSPGILTSVAAVGTTVDRGGLLYTVDGQPARLLYGTSPDYRAFTPGMSDGPDVAQLESNLVDMGMDPYHAITVDDHFSTATAAAISRWQAALGLPAAARTGTLDAGAVIFQPGPVRVSQIDVAVGENVQPGARVLGATSPARAVTVELTTDQLSLIHIDDHVLIVLPGDAGTTPGTVTRIDHAAAPPAVPGSGTSGGQGAPPAIQQAMVAVTIGVDQPAALASLNGVDTAPVQVAITTAEHTGVLLVPVTALLAAPDGGYQVRVTGPGSPRFVSVTPGLFDESAAMVEVQAADLHAGDQVEVPAS